MKAISRITDLPLRRRRACTSMPIDWVCMFTRARVHSFPNTHLCGSTAERPALGSSFRTADDAAAAASAASAAALAYLSADAAALAAAAAEALAAAARRSAARCASRSAAVAWHCACSCCRSCDEGIFEVYSCAP